MKVETFQLMLATLLDPRWLIPISHILQQSMDLLDLSTD
jgi:hypothetical protein